MSAVEVHADALEWVTVQVDVTTGGHGLWRAGVVFAKSVLTRHTPVASALGSRCSSDMHFWPCPDAQAALDFIKAIR